MRLRRSGQWLPLGLLSIGAATVAILSTLRTQPVPAVAPAEGTTLAPLVEAVRATVVGVSTVAEGNADVSPEVREFWRRFFGQEPPSRERMGIGSGVIIDPKGIVLTNHHVVAGAKEVKIRTADEKEHRAVVVGTDPPTDVAVLRIPDLTDPLPAATLGDSDATQVGDYVIAIGSPFGLELTVTSGIISAKARVLGAGPFDDFLQTDAAINPGNSGGPLFDLEGRVVGINTAIVAAGQGIGFAVPINLVKSSLPQLEATGKVVRGYMGVAIQDLTPELADALGLQIERGALVASVSPDGPARDSDIEPGDVIVSLNGQPIEGARDLSRQVSRLPPEQTIRLGVRREGREREVEITLGERPEQDRVPGAPPAEEGDQGLGLQIAPVPPQVRERLGIQGGVLVVDVRPGSRADQAGLSPEDVIVEVDREPVRGPEDFVEKVRAAGGEEMLLRVLRGEGGAYLVVPPA